MQKGFSAGDLELIRSIPRAMAETDLLCSSVNIGSTKAGINMDAVALMGKIVKEAAELTAGRQSIGCAKLVVLCNAPEDNPFMAGAFHGVGEPDCVINVGVSGPGVVRAALRRAGPDVPVQQLADVVKKTAFKASLSERRRRRSSGFRSASSIFRSPPPRRSGIRSPISSRRWASRNAEDPEPPPASRF